MSTRFISSNFTLPFRGMPQISLPLPTRLLQISTYLKIFPASLVRNATAKPNRFAPHLPHQQTRSHPKPYRCNAPFTFANSARPHPKRKKEKKKGKGKTKYASFPFVATRRGHARPDSGCFPNRSSPGVFANSTLARRKADIVSRDRNTPPCGHGVEPIGLLL